MKAHLLIASCLGACPVIMAQTWTEVGEAGNLPSSAQTPDGVGALTQINGTFNDPSEPRGAANDRDMYLIHVANPAMFRATTAGGTTLDTQLFLFDQSGHGVTFKAGSAGRTTITGQFVPAAGLYYLAISRFDRDPIALGFEIWLDTPITVERAPDGPSAELPIDAWNGLATSSVTGAYSIFLTGASFPARSCAELTISRTGAPRTALTFALTGAQPNALAFLALGTTQGPCSVEIGALGTFELGLEPSMLHPMGRTDQNGDASRRVVVPPGWRHATDLFAQGLSAKLTFDPPGPPSISVCTSGVEPIPFGN